MLNERAAPEKCIFAIVLLLFMQTILLIGAGRSSTTLIQYLLKHAAENDWMLTVGDASEELAKSKTANHQRGKGIRFDIRDNEQRKTEISKADCVISMLPAHMHLPVAVECIRQKIYLQ